MEDLRRSKWMMELSSQAQDIVMSSWSSGTTKSYNTYLKQWAEFCTSKNIDASQATVNVGIEFLTYLFTDKKLGYSAINSARSALSNFIQTNQTVPFGKLDVVSRFMKGIFRLRPSLPKYTVIYDPQIVLDYLKTITDMNLKSLTLKLTTLLCFVTGQRNQTIHSLDKSCMHDDGDEKITFFIPTILKTTTRGKHLKPIELIEYDEDQSLCVVTHIRLYLDVTKSIRKNHNKLLLSYVAPHLPVSAATTARWVKQTLADAGINTTLFTPHSTRAASTSSANQKGLSLADIRRAAGWRPGSTFATFYQKPIVKNFGRAVIH